MRRISPAFPDLLPLTHRLGPPPAVPFDLVDMRLQPRAAARGSEGERGVPRRPVRLLVEAEAARAEAARLLALLKAGCGALIVVRNGVRPADLPEPEAACRLVVASPWVAPLWGGAPLPELGPWCAAGIPAGVILGLAVAPHARRLVADAVEEAAARGATWVLGLPLAVSAEDRHRAYEALSGEGGDATVEDLLFHTDLAQLSVDLEREVTRASRAAGLREGLPGPATAGGPDGAFAACADLLLWARRLDLLDGVGSAGWQLRRAANALLASGRDPAVLVAEDNLRIVPGFGPWVEAFARALWAGSGEPFDEALARWLAG